MHFNQDPLYLSCPFFTLNNLPFLLWEATKDSVSLNELNGEVRCCTWCREDWWRARRQESPWVLPTLWNANRMGAQDQRCGWLSPEGFVLSGVALTAPCWEHRDGRWRGLSEDSRLMVKTSFLSALLQGSLCNYVSSELTQKEAATPLLSWSPCS